jgi:RNA polymerase sigma-70 factor (ECF subfamily)
MGNVEKPACGATCGVSFDDLLGLSDEELFVHLGHQDADAVAVLYQRYKRLVFAVASQILRDDGEAEDVLQNVFVDIFKTNLRYDPARGTVKMWILQFAYHRSFRRRRQLKSRHFYSSVELSEVHDSLAAMSFAITEVENKHFTGKVLKTLGGAQKRVLELACQDGMSLQDIAAATGEKIENVRHHYYRGLQVLRAKFRVSKEVKMSGPRKEASDATT